MAGSTLEFDIEFDDHMFTRISKEVDSVLQSAIVDITNDLLSTAQARAPQKKGNLVQSGSMQVNKSSKTGSVSFRATRRGYNYARKLDQRTYKLGKLSRKKASAKSKFYSGSMPVGTGYLSDTAVRSRAGYEKHVEGKIKNVTNRYK